MNCHNHIVQPAVAQCMDCSRGLCSECVSAYSIPICATCNSKRINAERNRIVKELLLTFVLGSTLAYFFYQWTNGGHSFPLLYNIISYIIPFYIFSGIVPGWKTLTRITPAVFLFLPIIGWVFYFIVKLLLSLCIGLVMLPIRIVKNTSRLITLRKINV